MLNTVSVLIIIIIVISLHEVVKKFLLYNAMLSSSAVAEQVLFIVVKTDWLTKHSTVLLLLSESSLLNSCVGKCNMLLLSSYSISLS